MITICLCLIVETINSTILSLLQNALPIVDVYCIGDRGSSDQTTEIITTFLKDKIEGRWVRESSVSRELHWNMVLQESITMGTSHLLLLDADMDREISFGQMFSKNQLLHYDAFYVFKGSAIKYHKEIRLIKSHPKIQYVGITDGYLTYPSDFKTATLNRKDVWIIQTEENKTSLSFKTKVQRTIEELEHRLKTNREDAHSWFYLGIYYKEIENYEKAIVSFQMRLQCPHGFSSEIWYSEYQLGYCHMELEHYDIAISHYLNAYNIDPTRIENLYRLLVHYRKTSKYNLCSFLYDKIISILANQKEEDSDYLFYEADIPAYHIDYEYHIIAFYLGIRKIPDIFLHLLNHYEDWSKRNSIYGNLRFYDCYLEPRACHVIEIKDRQRTYKHLKYHHCSNSSMSLLDYNERQYIMNIRVVSYRLNHETINYNTENDTIVTWNDLYFVNKDTFEIESQHFMNGPECSFLHHVNGAEDIKIYRSVEEDHHVYYLASFYSYFEGIKNCSIIRGRYDMDNKIISEPFRLHWEERKEVVVEKNWVHVVLENKDYFIYQWHPLILLTLGEVLEETFHGIKQRSVHLHRIIQTPLWMKHCRGSSNGYIFQNEIWFVIHFIDQQDDFSTRYYYHIIVVWEINTMKLLRYSPILKLSKFQIDYCLGIVVDHEQVILCVSEMDNKSIIKTYSKQELERQMYPSP